MTRIPPHNTKDTVYDFINNYPELGDNLLSDLESLKPVYENEMKKEFSTGAISEPDLETMKSISALFGYLLYSQSNGRQYNFKGKLTERINAVYSSVSPLSNVLRSQRRSSGADYFKEPANG